MEVRFATPLRDISPGQGAIFYDGDIVLGGKLFRRDWEIRCNLFRSSTLISATIRDIAIIIIAVETIVIGALLGILIWQVWRLVRLLQNEIKPIIQNTQETVNTVKGTATFMSDNVVNPVMKTSSKLVGAAHRADADLRLFLEENQRKTKQVRQRRLGEDSQVNKAPPSIEVGLHFHACPDGREGRPGTGKGL